MDKILEAVFNTLFKDCAFVNDRYTIFIKIGKFNYQISKMEVN